MDAEAPPPSVPRPSLEITLNLQLQGLFLCDLTSKLQIQTMTSRASMTVFSSLSIHGEAAPAEQMARCENNTCKSLFQSRTQLRIPFRINDLCLLYHVDGTIEACLDKEEGDENKSNVGATAAKAFEASSFSTLLQDSCANSISCLHDQGFSEGPV